MPIRYVPEMTREEMLAELRGWHDGESCCRGAKRWSRREQTIVQGPSSPASPPLA